MNQREIIISKINELQKLIDTSSEDITSQELAEYLVKVEKLKSMLAVMAETINEKK